MFESVLVANRGEIARRVVRTLRRVGVRSVAIYTDADRRAPHVREADGALHVASYLDAAELVEAARRAGADAVHPGYGFLSENPGFARACAQAGVTFVGPPPEAMEAMGDKLRAKAVADRAGVPVVPSFTVEQAREAHEHYPLLVKAAAGGGGRGMRVVERPDDLDAALESARREAQAGFGDDTVFIERFLPRARHIEVQVIADAHGNVLHLGERECSLQRRHQKIVEESPSPVVDAALRARLGEEAVALARAAGYVNAGTVEFIADADDPATHFFLEVNARLQVEHPVTELVTGLDLVELQLRVAAGEPLALTQDDVRLSGHAIEVRVNAEDAAAGFLPAAGPVLGYREPEVAGVRVDSGIARRSRVGTDYDSLLCKVIAHGADRDVALARLDRALADTAILGVTTTVGYLRRLLATPEVRAGALDTGLVGRLELPPTGVDEREVAAAAALIQTAVNAERAGDDPFESVRGWRVGGVPGWSYWLIAVDGGAPVDVRVRGVADRPEYDVGDGPIAAEVDRVGPQAFAIAVGGERRTWDYAYEGNVIWLGRDGQVWTTRRASREESHEASVHGDLRAPMPGQVLLVKASPGDRVAPGDAVVVLESMKMELTVAAPMAGRVAAVAVAVGDQVVQDQPVATIEPDAGEMPGELPRLVALPAEDEAAWP
ncbi:MAG TPA: biotin carboxylase N-terminal domain-containing protein [Solirubrobacteraceae bacterium]|nr:biotin carboxylase N-terminal domain-containing protein [Solirubrobacteraceae bacterium]